ncbi:rhombosortase [Aquabacterium lacunae]|uniref:Rhombosortase n=1 Tax=Aquabacterium lacunae TaxID=2528630 RepID=A0A4Q9H4W8_9BURK|nr:rhombosortase [Aquabacterium lacunae]TBO34075.1 rhombosortase [Aquabacterium lacunae]
MEAQHGMPHSRPPPLAPRDRPSLPLLACAAAGPVALAAAVHAAHAAGMTHLPLLHEAVSAGQPWRLLTGHWVHTNTAHLLLNAGGWALVVAAHFHAWQRMKGVQHLVVWTGLCLLTSTLLLTAWPQVSPYMGLSGVLHGWWLWLACRSVRDGDTVWGWGSLAVLGGKLAYEAGGAQGATADWIGARVAVEGHVCGAIAAAGMLLAHHLLRRWQSRSH